MTIDTRLSSASLSLHGYASLTIDKLCCFANFAETNPAADAPVSVRTCPFTHCIFPSRTVHSKSNCRPSCNKGLSVMAQDESSIGDSSDRRGSNLSSSLAILLRKSDNTLSNSCPWWRFLPGTSSFPSRIRGAQKLSQLPQLSNQILSADLVLPLDPYMVHLYQ